MNTPNGNPCKPALIYPAQIGLAVATFFAARHVGQYGPKKGSKTALKWWLYLISAGGVAGAWFNFIGVTRYSICDPQAEYDAFMKDLNPHLDPSKGHLDFGDAPARRERAPEGGRFERDKAESGASVYQLHRRVS